MKKSSTDASVSSEERYKSFIAHSSEGIWRIELEKPLSVKTPIKKQLDHFYQYSYLAECNDAMARMYGLRYTKEIIGARLGDLLIRTDEKNTKYLTDFITSGYKLQNRESYELDKLGNRRVFLNNLVGSVKQGNLVRAWGTQRDITTQIQEKERQEFLEKVNSKLAVSLNHHITLQEIAQLIVPYLADYCRIAIVDEKKNIKEITVNHTDPNKVSLAEDLYDAYKDKPQSTYGIPSLLKKGKPELMKVIDDSLLRKYKADTKTIQIVKQIGLKSYMGVPLIARNKVIGAMTFSSIQENRHYTKNDVKFAEELAHRIALTLDNIRLFQEAQIELDERKHIENNLRFLAEAGKILGSSLDYQTTLNQVAKLAVPQISDWFGIDIFDDKGELQQIAVGHKDPQKIKWAKEMRKKYPPNMEAKNGLPQVLKTGKSELYPFITPEMMEKTARDKEHMQYIKQIGMSSAMIVPLISERKPIGAVTYVSTKRHFTQSDLAIAEELAHRASLAIENARLYNNAQKAITLRDDFISVASHELKTPITSVKIFTQVLQKHAEQNADEKASQSLGKMDKQIDKLTELIYNLLNITKIQSGQMEFTEKEFDFDTMVHEIVDVLQHTSAKHKLVVVGKSNKKILGDEDRIGQVFSNLISNAIKYSPNSDKVVITLTSKRNYVGVSIQDFGIGMDKHHLNKIFNRFYRVSGSTDKTFPGLGIGLYISKEIINRHQGKLWAESIPGKGSTFYITLPVQQSAKPATLPRLRN